MSSLSKSPVRFGSVVDLCFCRCKDVMVSGFCVSLSFWWNVYSIGVSVFRFGEKGYNFDVKSLLSEKDLLIFISTNQLRRLVLCYYYDSNFVHSVFTILNNSKIVFFLFLLQLKDASVWRSSRKYTTLCWPPFLSDKDSWCWTTL